MRNTIIGIGEALWDVLPEGKKIGGAPANFAYIVSQFGLRSVAVSALGNDVLGKELQANLDEKKLEYILPVVPFPTGTVQVSLNAEGIPVYEIKENVAWDNIPFTEEFERLAQSVRAVCFGSLAQRNGVSHDTINRFLDAIPDEEGIYKIFDINLRQHFYTPELLNESMMKCNILKINDEELEVIKKLFGYSDTDAEATCRKLQETYGLKILILTCGTNGSYVFAEGHPSFISTPKVKVADTVGAGDSFTAAFVAALLNGTSVAQAHKLAVAVSAYVCTQHGAMSVLPNHLRSMDV
mgnify:FL=1